MSIPRVRPGRGVPRLAPLALLAGVAFACTVTAPPPATEQEMAVEGVRLDRRQNAPVVVLRELDGERVLPIWIGFSEAASIARVLESVPAPRPDTHDLLRNLLVDALDVRVLRVSITELRDATYYAVIELEVDGQPRRIDSRPSDAIALALRTRAAIFANEQILQRSERTETDTPPASERLGESGAGRTL